MYITLKNYHHFTNKAKRIVNASDKDLKEMSLNNTNNLVSPSFQSVINFLNNSSILNSSSKNNLIINFEDFTILNRFILNQKDYFKRKLNKWFKTDFTTTDDYAFYSKEDKKIHIREHLFNQQNQHYSTTFSQHLKDKVQQSDFLNFAVLHEIGHATHHQYYLEHKKQLSGQTNMSDFINQTVSFNGYVDLVGNIGNQSKTSFRNKDLNVMNFHAVSEGFADLYACIAISQTYPKNEAINLISCIIESRKEADKGHEFYQTHTTLEFYLNEFKNNKIVLQGFNEMYKYMSSIIEKTVKNNIEAQLLKVSSPEIELNNRYLGLINKQLNLNDSNSVIESLNKEYSLNLNKIQYIENEFQFGEILYEKNKYMFHLEYSHQKVKLNIQNIRNKNFSNDSKNKNTFIE